MDNIAGILKGDARYYNNQVRDQVSNYGEVVSAIGRNFNGLATRSRAKNRFLSQIFDQYLTSGRHTANALAKLVADIDRYFPQVPSSDQY